MRLFAVAVLAAAAALAGTASARPSETVLVGPDGTVGALRLDRSTEAELRRVAGQPAKVAPVEAGGGSVVGAALRYRCGAGCTTWYYVSLKTGRLSDFESNSPRLATSRGTRVGMTRAEAERREGVRATDGCLLSIVLRSGKGRLELEIANGRVSRFRVSGRTSIVSC